MHPSVYSTTINNSQIMERAKCPPTDEWIKKLWFIYTMEYYLAMRRNEIWPSAATWMELEGIMLRNKSVRERYHIFSLICGS